MHYNVTALGDSTYADVKFIITESNGHISSKSSSSSGSSSRHHQHIVYAHRFILENRSEYFRVLFRSNIGLATMTKQQNDKSTKGNHVGNDTAGGMVTIAVPDSYIGLVRMLIFLYTATLPMAVADGVLLEDLMSADR